MISRSFARRRGASLLLGSALALGLVGAAAPALADQPSTFDAALSTGSGSVTVDLGATQYPSAPTGLSIQALRNGCSTGSPCWSEEDASLTVGSDFNGVYTLTGLMPHTRYQIDVLAYLDGDQGHSIGYITTPDAVNGAPSAYPTAVLSKDGIHASVTAQAEYDAWNVHDGGSIGALRYNVYAYVDGKRFKKVLSNVAPGTAHTISGLPLKKRISFTETDANSVGESPESTPSGVVTLAPVAPAAFTGTSYTAQTSTELVWNRPAAGTGRLTKFVVRLDRAARSVYSHTYSAKTKDAEIQHLKRHTHYVAFITAWNSYGEHLTIRGVFTTK